MNPFEGLKHLIKSKAEHDGEFLKLLKYSKLSLIFEFYFQAHNLFGRIFLSPNLIKTIQTSLDPIVLAHQQLHRTKNICTMTQTLDNFPLK